MPTAIQVPLQQLNPATLEVIGEVASATPGEIERVMGWARRAFPAWSAKTPRERAQAVARLKPILQERADEIALLLTRSTGKPIVESYTSEIFPVAYLLDYFVKRAPRMLRSQKVPLPLMRWSGRRSTLEFRPVGVVAVIGPWNYPFSIPMGDALLGLLAGCPIIIKPSEVTPLVGRLIADCFSAAELPVWVVQGGGAVGAALIDARPDKIIFTGGTATGKKVMEAASRHLIPVVLELGGKDPMIVDADANLANASSAAVWGCFTNSGQVCASVKRLIVAEKVADELTEAVVRKAKALRIGDPTQPTTDIGAMTSRMQIDRVEEQVRAAEQEGAVLAAGGRRREDLKGLFFEPAVFTCVQPTMRVAREEIFGPVLPILKVGDMDEAVRIANDSPLGLSASVWSRRRGQEIARRIEAGTVTINDTSYTHALCETPWGGVKESGFGRTHGLAGLLEFVNPFHVNENRMAGRRSMWWFPYDADMVGDFQASIRWACATGGWERLKRLGAMAKRVDLEKLKPRP